MRIMAVTAKTTSGGQTTTNVNVILDPFVWFHVSWQDCGCMYKRTPVGLSNGFRFKDSVSLDNDPLLLQLETVDTTLSSKSSGFGDYRGWIQKPDISQGLHGHPTYYCPLQGIRTKDR
ncbi:unnamed protein product [Pleuronectes platessa]|uniref:Uncharacterized protein n=1 Tax=Pleuronectes platessa TaxID=8262 RepID=A0A9N7YLU0_PLEPL|nr:unnamed protein product [Pleuronectes platessa]